MLLNRTKSPVTARVDVILRARMPDGRYEGTRKPKYKSFTRSVTFVPPSQIPHDQFPMFLERIVKVLESMPEICD